MPRENKNGKIPVTRVKKSTEDTLREAADEKGLYLSEFVRDVLEEKAEEIKKEKDKNQ